MKRIGIVGGSFDPVHIGHLMLAEYAKSELKLDQAIMIPCYQSTYKNKVIKTLPKDREHMLSRCQDLLSDHIMTFDCNPDWNYTIDMVKYFINAYKNYKFTLIVGADTIDNFDSWKDSKKIKKLVDVNFANKDFYVPRTGVSSTLIRNLVKEGKSIKHLVPKQVNDYIIKNNLYK